jgi:16S rRNA (guanine1207-N2)-methyltransferase
MPADAAITLVLERVQRHLQQPSAKPLLVIADEQLAALDNPPVSSAVRYLSNRYDVAASLERHGATIDLSDFDTGRYADAAFLGIVYRISKEKAVVNHIINAAPRLLTDNGEITLIGHKNEGLNSYSKHAGNYLGGSSSIERGVGAYRAVSFTCGPVSGKRLDDSDYARIRPIHQDEQDLTLYSKPGIYGWQKIDRGSSLLVAAIRNHLAGSDSPQINTVLDLGCGYGYISVMLAYLGASHILATDNNIAAVNACRQNFIAHGITGEVRADDCAGHIDQRFDTVVCNPPFHLGFDTSRALTAKFLNSARRRLLPAGRAFFVVNQFISIEGPALDVFKSVQEIHRGEGFKVLLMST